MQLAGDSRLTDRRVTEWLLLEKAKREGAGPAQAAREAAVGAQPVITISREFGAGGHTIACALAEALGPAWQVWDKEIIEAVAQSAKVRSEMVEALDERARSWIDEMSQNLANVNLIETLTYRRHLVLVLLALAHQGRKILLGRSANLVVPEALNVRLCGSVPYRVRETAAREGISEVAALRRVHQVDRERQEFTRSVFGRDVGDVSTYDIVLQMDRLSAAAATAAIVAAARATYGNAI